MKKIMIIFFLLTGISFYVTNLVVNNMKDNDPIMEQIKYNADKYKNNYINAEVKENTITSGKYGRDIDYIKSYNKMKKYGAYNEVMITLKDVKPVVSIEDNYDKYLVGGNKDVRAVSLIFIGDKLTEVMNILQKEQVVATFFVDGINLEENTNILKKTNNEIEILSYNNSYDKGLFKTAISYLESIRDEKVKYCYTEKDNQELLKLCQKLKLHTIKPTITVDKNLYGQIKNNLTNSSIISIKINNYTLKELSSTIKYIKSKGYSIKKIDNLLTEKIANN